MKATKSTIYESIETFAFGDVQLEAAIDALYEIKNWSSFHDNRFSLVNFIEWLKYRANRYAELEMQWKSTQFNFLVNFLSK